MPRPKRVADLGCGKRPKFAVDYALREPGTQVSAVDLGMIGYRRYLQSLGHMEVPTNLRVFHRKDAVGFLKGQGRGSFDELHAHLLLTNMGYEQRRRLYEQARRALDHGGQFRIVEGAYMRRQVPFELRQHGFEVSTRRIGDEEFEAIGMGMAKLAVRQSHQMRDYIRMVSGMSPQEFQRFARGHALRPASARDLIEKKKGQAARRFSRFLSRLNLREPSEGARDANRVIVADTRHMYGDKPYVIVTARKPNVRPMPGPRA